MTATGAVAAGHPLTAEAGARVLREGGNAVDAAVAAVLTSFVAESPLTGLGAGGFMLVHTADEDVLLDFFVEMPVRGGIERGADLGTGEVFRFPELGDALERYAGEGPAAIYGGEVGPAIASWVTKRGGTLTIEDLDAYQPVARAPVRAAFRGREILSNPPPSA